MAGMPGPVAAVVAAVLVWAAMAAATVHAAGASEPRDEAQAAGPRLLDVPYLSQTEVLCGGAAVAMVLRYWGERQIFPEDFASLVDRSAAGIRTDVLAAELTRRGWQSFPINGNSGSGDGWVRDHLEHGRPIVALIEVARRRYHYVVIVAWTSLHVVVLDPARVPFRVMSRGEFDRTWAAAGRWALLLLPAPDRPSEELPTRTAPTLTPAPPGQGCETRIDEMVRRGRAGAVAEVDAGLLSATLRCPHDPVAWRELAAVRFLQSRWSEAGTLAARAAELDPSDAQSWELLATSRFLSDEPESALDAWNRHGSPVVDLVRVTGARRTRHPAVVAVVDLPPRSLLTSNTLGRANRRLQELPSASRTQLTYHPVEGGLAEVEAAVVERATVPHGVVPMVAMAGRALIQNEVRLEVTAPTGSGERLTVAWRWQEARPRLAFSLAVPRVSKLPGVVAVEGLWQRSSYDVPAGPSSDGSSPLIEERRRAGVSLSDWGSRSVRWKAGSALDRWGGTSFLSVDAAVDLRSADDRGSLRVDAAAWAPVGGAGRFATGGASYAWRSTRESDRPSWRMVTGFAATSASAPRDLWPGAGTGQARVPLLRAHPLLDAGILNGPAFGQRLLHGTFEYQRPILERSRGAVRLAVFADAARPWQRDVTRTAIWHTDIGAGIRLSLPDTSDELRIDVARGLRDGRVVLSASWLPAWPGG